MSNPFTDQIKEIAAWFLSSPPVASLEPKPLTTTIYEKFYCHQSTGSGAPQDTEQPQFLESLSAANTTKDDINLNWVVQQRLADGLVRASKASHSILLQPQDYIPVEPTGSLDPGSRIARVFYKERRDIQPVFYYAFSNALVDTQTTLMRLYWNIRPEYAAQLLREASTRFNRYHLPYVFKFLNSPSLYRRKDSAVLYVPKQYLHTTASIIPEIHARAATGMIDDIPLFTLRLARGLGYADNPPTGESFGIHRCGLIAKGLLAATNNGQTELSDCLTNILHEFEMAGIDPDRPYLNPGSRHAMQPLQKIDYDRSIPVF